MDDDVKMFTAAPGVGAALRNSALPMREHYMPTIGDEQRLIQRRTGLIAYLRLKVDENEWHGVADAAMDLREVDAKLELLRDGK